MKFRYKEYCTGTFFYIKKEGRKQGKVSKREMDYKLLLDTAVFAGDILMQNGAETYRVEDTVYRILQKSNLKTVQVLVMMTGFVATLDDPSMDSLTVVRRIQSHGTNLEKIDRVNQISREFCNDELTLEEAFKQMKALWKEKERLKIRLSAFAFLTGGFAVMFGSNWAEAIVAAVVGIVGAVVQFSCKKGHMHMFVENIVCSLSVAVAIGFLTAVYLSKVAPKKVRTVLEAAVSLLAGIPSVVYGLVGMLVLVPAIRKTFHLPDGASLFAAIIVLAVMILPSIIKVSVTALEAVPHEYEDASLALGATEVETYFRVSVPAAKSGIAAAVVLGVGRAIGEAMAVMMVSGNAPNMPGSIFESVRFLTTAVASEMSYSSGLQRQALFSIALVLYLFILLINAALNFFLKRDKEGN